MLASQSLKRANCSALPRKQPYTNLPSESANFLVLVKGLPDTRDGLQHSIGDEAFRQDRKVVEPRVLLRFFTKRYPYLIESLTQGQNFRLIHLR